MQTNKVDIHQIHSINLGLNRESFERVVDLSGFLLTPFGDTHYIWDFQHPETGEQGRLLHVEGFLGGGGVSFSVKGQAYLITRQGLTLALLFPISSRRKILNPAAYKIIPKTKKKIIPVSWPLEMVSKVIRSNFRQVVIINESFLLEKIGLKTTKSVG